MSRSSSTARRSRRIVAALVASVALAAPAAAQADETTPADTSAGAGSAGTLVSSLVYVAPSYRSSWT